MPSRPKPVILLILDGFGYRENPEDNAIALANTPCWDRLMKDYPLTLLNCSGNEVGLPGGQMGNSEVGHIHIGSGRLVAQDFLRVDMAVDDESFFANEALCHAVDRAIENGKALHVFGLLSPGGVHSHERHIQAMVKLAADKGLKKIYLHAFLDGRDVPPRSAADSIRLLENEFEQLGVGQFASIGGRFYAMDRDNRWDRVKKAYDLIVNGKCDFTAETASKALQEAYARDESDEFVQPTALPGDDGKVVTVEDGDSIVFMNFRADRARELCKTFMPDFSEFERGDSPPRVHLTTLTEYHEDFDFPVAYPPMAIANSLGEVVSNLGLKQLRLAETEKYAHVTFFLNGGREQPFAGEDRVLIPSPKVKTYDLQPEMSAEEVTDRLVSAIENREYDMIICNYANCDMVGHTGNLPAAIKAVEKVDESLARIVAALESVGGEMLVTADHGNIEKMYDKETGQPHTAHTTNPVPLLYVGKNRKLQSGGDLSDLAPTLLDIMGIELPKEMTGHSLLV
ncbi:MAG: 2,3-bisphosphoglycerate-independent phosphoglycerate mutase [Gammaproteobacteria bacterium]